MARHVIKLRQASSWRLGTRTTFTAMDFAERQTALIENGHLCTGVLIYHIGDVEVVNPDKVPLFHGVWYVDMFSEYRSFRQVKMGITVYSTSSTTWSWS